MAEETTFEKPAPLDLGSPQGLRKWFHLSGRHYPEEREKEMLSEIPRAMEDAQSFSTQKERDDYSEFLRAKYTRDPLHIPSRYSRENLSARGVAANKIREMQSRAAPTLQNIYRDISSDRVPLSVESAIESTLGTSFVPDATEPLDKYQGNIMAPTNLTDIPSRIRKHAGALASTKYLNPNARTEVLRRGAEDYQEAPVSTNDVFKKAGSLASHAFTPPIASAYNLGSAVYQGVKDLGSMGPMKRKRFSDAILRLTGQQPKDKWVRGSSGLENYYDEDGTLLVR